MAARTMRDPDRREGAEALSGQDTYPRYRPGAYGAMTEVDDGSFVDIRDIADDLQEVLRVFYATANLTEQSVGAAEKLDALISEKEGD